MTVLVRIGSRLRESVLKPDPRFFLCDPSLTSMSGHCFGYLSPLRDLICSQGQIAYIIGNRGMDPDFAREADVRPAFTYWCDERHVGQADDLNPEDNANAIRIAHEAALVRNLIDLDLTFQFRSTDLVIINTLRHWALGGVATWLKAKGIERAPRFLLVMLFSSEPDLGQSSPAGRFYRNAFDCLLELNRPDRIKVVADSDSLIAEYQELSALRIELAPFPQSVKPGCIRTASPLVRLGYVGEAREHKGFHHLPFLVNYINRSSLGRNIRFEIHSYIGNKQQLFYQQAISSLQSSLNVNLYSEILTNHSYENLLDSIDVFLLPYGLSHYHRQTSAIYHSAVSRDCPVVVTRGTWMAKKVQELGGGTFCNADDCLSLAEATLELCENIEDYRSEAAAAGKQWRRFNNAKSFLGICNSFS